MNSQTSRSDEANNRTEVVLRQPRLNIFALPSLTTLLFALIACVILIATAAGLRQNPSLIGLMIASGMVILPLRGFLRRVDQDLGDIDLSRSKAEASASNLAHGVEKAAHDLGLTNSPQLLFAPHPTGPRIIGSWRRRYLVVGHAEADHLSKLPEPTQRALWLHEVAHFANGDHWKVGLAHSLLHTSVVFMTWSGLFLLAIVVMAFLYGLEVFEPGYLDTLSLDPAVREMLVSLWPDPVTTAEVLKEARDVQPGLAALYVVNAHLPFVFSGIVLLLFVWRRLVQVREFYADARVAVQIGEAERTRQTLVQVAQATALWSPATTGHFRSLIENLGQQFNRILPFHPSWPVRFECLRDPSQVFGTWIWAGLTAGLAVLLLDLILVGPYTLSYVSDGPAHFPTLAGFVILALWLLPRVCQGFATTTHMIRQIIGATLLFVGLRTVWLVLNTGIVLVLLAIDPEMLRFLLNAIVFLSNKTLTDAVAPSWSQDPFTLAQWSVVGGWSFALLVLLCLLGFLLLVGVLLRRLLTWYALPHAERRLLRAGWSVILILALVLGLVVLPPPTALILGNWGSFVQPLPLASEAVTVLLVLAWAVWFLRQDRRYGRRCPSCDKDVPGWYELGKRCPACGRTLHPWLLARY